MDKLIEDMDERLKNFIDRASEIHNGKYDYSLVTEYKNNKTKIPIICHELDKNGEEHGVFWQTPSHHINREHGCPKCKSVNLSSLFSFTTDEFIRRAREVHGDKYDYSKVEYKGASEKVCIICPEHGEFWQRAWQHLQGRGCIKCGYKSEKHTKPPVCKKKPQEKFIEEAAKKHNAFYDYSEVVYNGGKEKVTIICPIHGRFTQTATSHLMGCGCPLCNSSHLENDMRSALQRENIQFEEQKTFDWLKTSKNRYLKFDFFIPEYNIAIECQGEQHFVYRQRFHLTKENYIECMERDRMKYNKSKKHGVRLFYFAYPVNVYKNGPNWNELYDNNLLLSSDEVVNAVKETIYPQNKKRNTTI